MAKTNLAYIGEVAEAAVARELDQPRITTATREQVAQAALKVVAGFKVHDETAERDALDTSLAQRRAQLEAFCRDRGVLQQRLHALGVEPRTTVPKAMWERLCTESGLFMLSPDKNGDVHVNGAQKLAQWRAEAAVFVDRLTGGVFLSTAILAFALFAYLVWSRPAPDLWVDIAFTAFACLPAILAGVFVTVLTVGLGEASKQTIRVKSRFIDRQLRRFARLPWGEQLRALWPEGKSEGNLLVQLILPPPPKDVAITLLKVSPLSLHVVVAGEAIGFAESPAEILDRVEKHRKAKAAEERLKKLYHGYSSYEEYLAKCPIITTEHGSAVAIIAQFGDFPIEKEVVDRVVNSEYLL